MEWISDERMRLALLFGGMFVLFGAELFFPLRRAVRDHVVTNLLLTLGLILVNLLCSALVLLVALWAESRGLGLFRWLSASVTLQVITGLLFLDFWAAYLSHYLCHRIGWLWRIHSVHHSDTMVDVTTAFRQHPIETLFRITFYATGQIILGIPTWILLLYLTLSAVNAQLEHANIKMPLPIDRLLRWFYVTPNMHKIHHSKFQPETDSNYSNIFSIWDRMFGTFRTRASYDDVPYGLDYLSNGRQLSFWSLIILPFRRYYKENQ